MRHLQQLVDDPTLLHEWRPTDQRVLVAAPDAQARETYRRTTFPFRWSTEKRGKNPNSWKPFVNQRRLFFRCGKGGCNHLVCVPRAYQKARKDSRERLKPGDGCPNGKCHNRKKWKRNRVAAYQRTRITKINEGSYILVRRPSSIGQKTITLVKTTDMEKIVAAAAGQE